VLERSWVRGLVVRSTIALASIAAVAACADQSAQVQSDSVEKRDAGDADGSVGSGLTDAGDERASEASDGGAGLDVHTDNGPTISCPNGRAVGSIEVLTQVDLELLAGCREIDGSLFIRGSDITDLSPLSSLERLDGMLYIGETELIHDLTSLTSLRTVQSLLLKDNAGLVSLSGMSLTQMTRQGADGPRIALFRNPLLESLDGLQSLSAQPDLDVTVVDAPRLTNLDALAGFDSFANVNLVRAPALTSLDGLGNATSIGWIALDEMPGIVTLSELRSLAHVTELYFADTGLRSFAGLDRITALNALWVKRNPHLDATAGFEALTVIESNASFEDNPALTSFAAFPALERVGLLVIAKHPALASLSSLSALRWLDGALTVTNNAALHRPAIEDWLSAVSVNGRVRIDGNADDAPHVTECPWANDGACDADPVTGTCPFDLDYADCCFECPPKP
jgi:hypothetical protein